MSGNVAEKIPESTIEWLLGEDNPAVAVLTRRSPAARARVRRARAAVGAAQRVPAGRGDPRGAAADGSWAPPPRDYQKYWGSLWQIHFLGELWADPADERVRRAAAYAFSRQRDDGMWSASNMQAHGAIPCLTANVGRALARLGYATDERVVAALAACVARYRELGRLGLQRPDARLPAQRLLSHARAQAAAVPRRGARRVLARGRRAAQGRVRLGSARQGGTTAACPPRPRSSTTWRAGTRPPSYASSANASSPSTEPLHYGDKPGWLRFGFPLSYNSDALEALASLAAVGEPRRPEYEAAIAVVEAAADDQMRWTLQDDLQREDARRRRDPGRSEQVAHAAGPVGARPLRPRVAGWVCFPRRSSF